MIPSVIDRSSSTVDGRGPRDSTARRVMRWKSTSSRSGLREPRSRDFSTIQANHCRFARPRASFREPSERNCALPLDFKIGFVTTSKQWKRSNPARERHSSSRRDGIVPTPGASERMAAIRQARTRPEAIVAADLRALGIRYRRNVRSLPGSPDFANVSRRWAIFVNGCFWHRHTGCRRATVPKSNSEFWEEKFRANRARDARAINSLRAKGFKVLVVWECSVAHQSGRLRQVLEPRGVNPRKP